MARDIPDWNCCHCIDEPLRLEPMMKDFKPMLKMATEAIQQAQSLVVYCDYIANTIKHALPSTGVQTSTVKLDMRSDGSVRSTTLFVEAEYLGKKYKIIVEEA